MLVALPQTKATDQLLLITQYYCTQLLLVQYHVYQQRKQFEPIQMRKKKKILEVQKGNKWGIYPRSLSLLFFCFCLRKSEIAESWGRSGRLTKIQFKKERHLNWYKKWKKMLYWLLKAEWIWSHVGLRPDLLSCS